MENSMKKMIELDFPELNFRSREAINLLRENIQMAGFDVKMIAFTSPNAHEGKSTISFYLACSLIKLNKKVLFLDCDIRNSNIKKNFHIRQNTVGLSEYLCGQISINDIIYQVKDSGLHMIFSGKAAPNPSELLSNELFLTLLDVLKENYEYVIVDTPPLNIVVDALIVSRKCDSTIIVVEAGETNRKDAINAQKRLEEAGVRIMGIVMNKSQYTGNSYGKYGYGSRRYGQYGKYGYDDT